ncbi:MAG: stalk domain-containing protein [Bacillota bacterium]|nr:stalk domain-containing protein [Bacillota bacterium]
MKKRISWLIVLLLFLALVAPAAYATESINIVLDGEAQKFSPEPIIHNNSTMVPMRAIFEALGASLEWDGPTNTVTSTKDNTTVKITIGASTAFVNGTEISLAAPAMIVNERTLVPLRFVSESLGALVDWDSGTRTIYIERNTDKVTSKLSLKELANLNESVVLINTYGPYSYLLGNGSGSIISADGLILTNYHVIEGITDAVVILENETSYPVEGVVYYSVEKDVAILKIAAENLPYLPLGNSDSLELGEDIAAIGSPLGLQNSISTGIVSGLNRISDGQKFIQISAPISPGNSGGALLNYYGQLVGIPTWQYIYGQNLNMAIPINEIKEELAQASADNLVSLSQLTKDNIGETTYEEFADMLHWEFFPITIDDIMFDSEYVYASDSEEFANTVLFSIWLDETSFINLGDDYFYNEGYRLDKLITELATAAKFFYPEKDFIGQILYYDVFAEHPGFFPEEAITFIDDAYEVDFLIVEFWDEDGEIFWFDGFELTN